MPDSSPQSSPAPPRQTGVVVPHRPNLIQRVAARLIQGMVNLLACTLRYRFTDYSGMTTGKLPGSFIGAIWHNRLALCMEVNRRYVQPAQEGRHLAALVSASKDGALLARVLELFDVHPVRGSSSRRGAQSLLELTRCVDEGHYIAITPDGPRGPRYQVHPGIITLAKVTGLPIVPITWNLGWKICLRSWDKFHLPLPFSRCEVFFGEPLRVPSEATEAELEALRGKLAERLTSLSKD